MIVQIVPTQSVTVIAQIVPKRSVAVKPTQLVQQQPQPEQPEQWKQLQQISCETAGRHGFIGALFFQNRRTKMDKQQLSNVCFTASLVSVIVSILTWVFASQADPAHAERFGIFIGLWAPTLMGLANYYKE